MKPMVYFKKHLKKVNLKVALIDNSILGDYHLHY